MPDRRRNETVTTRSTFSERNGRSGAALKSLAGRKALHFATIMILCSGIGCHQIPRRDSGSSSPKSSEPVQLEPDWPESDEFPHEKSEPAGPELIIPPRPSEATGKNSLGKDLPGPQLGDPFLGAGTRLDSWGKPDEASSRNPVKLTGEIVEIDLATGNFSGSLNLAENGTHHGSTNIFDRSLAADTSRWSPHEARKVKQGAPVISVNATESWEAASPLTILGGDSNNISGQSGPDADGFWQPLIVPGPSNPANRGHYNEAVPSASASPAPASLPMVEESSIDPGTILLAP